MKRFNKILRLTGVVLLLLLASVGVSIGGGVPVPSSRRKENMAETKIELVEEKEEVTTTTQEALKL